MTDQTMITPVTERKLSNHVSVHAAIRNSLTLAHRALLKIRHNPGTIGEIIILPTMLTLLFTYLFGSAISGDIASYLPIIIPGILMQACVTRCSNASALLREDMEKGATSRFKSMPIARISPLAGILIADLVRYAIAGIVVFIVGFILGYRPEAGIGAVGLSILSMMFVTWCLSWLFAFIGMSVKSVSAASGTSLIVMLPLVFLSNAFVPADTMPEGLKFFVLHINPLSRIVAAIRQILAEGTIGADFWFSLLGAVVLLAVFIPLTVISYKRKA